MVRRLGLSLALILLLWPSAAGAEVFLRRYGVAATVTFQIYKVNSPTFAVTGDWTPAAADCTLSRDEAADEQCDNTVAIAHASAIGKWKLVISAAEMTAARITVNIVDAATKAVDDRGFVIETFGDASAQHPHIPGPAVETTGGLITYGTAAGRLNVSSGFADADTGKWRGSVPDALVTGLVSAQATQLGTQAKADANLYRKNVAVARHPFKMVDATDLKTAETGLTVSCTRSIDGAAFAACATATATELANGWYYVALAASDLNGDVIILRMTAAGAHPHEQIVIPQP